MACLEYILFVLEFYYRAGRLFITPGDNTVGRFFLRTMKNIFLRYDGLQLSVEKRGDSNAIPELYYNRFLP
jgi:hypothetical protein